MLTTISPEFNPNQWMQSGKTNSQFLGRIPLVFENTKDYWDQIFEHVQVLRTNGFPLPIWKGDDVANPQAPSTFEQNPDIIEHQSNISHKPDVRDRKSVV